MTEAKWLSHEDAQVMLRWMNFDGQTPPWNLDLPRRHARKLRLFACACARQMIAFVRESSNPDTRRFLAAVEWGERMADGKPHELRHGTPGAFQAYWVVNQDPLDAALQAAQLAADNRGFYRIDGPALVREIFGNPFRPSTLARGACDHCKGYGCRKCNPVLAWNDGCVRKIAQGIYEDRAFNRLGILADALLDAGCDDEELIRHCRGEELIPQPATGNPPLAWYGPLRGPHVRGCWCLDLLLGRE